MKMMKTFDYNDMQPVWDAWTEYVMEYDNRGYIYINVDIELKETALELYSYFTASGVEHGEDILVEYDW